MLDQKRVETFTAFWPLYVREHLNAGCRTLHFVGSTLVLVIVGLALLTRLEWLFLAPLVGYGLAWIGHFCLEHNKPASFKYPLWSFIADWKMWALILTGRMDGEIQRAKMLAAK